MSDAATSDPAPKPLERTAASGSLLAKLVSMVDDLRARQAEDAARLSALAGVLESVRSASALGRPAAGGPNAVALSDAVSGAARRAVADTLHAALPTAVDAAMRAVLREHAEEEAAERARAADHEAPQNADPSDAPSATAAPGVDLQAMSAALSPSIADAVSQAVLGALGPRLEEVARAAAQGAPEDASEGEAQAGSVADIAARLDAQSARAAGLLEAAETQTDRLDAVTGMVRGLAEDLPAGLSEAVRGAVEAAMAGSAPEPSDQTPAAELGGLVGSVDDVVARLNGQVHRTAGLIAASDRQTRRLDAMTTAVRGLASEVREDVRESVAAAAREAVADALATRPASDAASSEAPAAVDLSPLMTAVESAVARLDDHASRAAGLIAASDHQTKRLDAMTAAVRGLASEVRNDVRESVAAAAREAVADALATQTLAAPSDGDAEGDDRIQDLTALSGAVENAVARLDGQTDRAAGLVAVQETHSKRLDAATLALRALLREVREVAGAVAARTAPADDALATAGQAQASAPAPLLDEDALEALSARLSTAVRAAVENAGPARPASAESHVAESHVAETRVAETRVAETRAGEPEAAPIAGGARISAEAAKLIVAFQGLIARIERTADRFDAATEPRPAETPAAVGAIAEALAKLGRAQAEILEHLSDMEEARFEEARLEADCSDDVESGARATAEPLTAEPLEDLQWRVGEFAARLAQAVGALQEASIDPDAAARLETAATEIAESADRVLDVAAAVMREQAAA
ncbi:MAG: hypothetical protein AAFW46_04565 [Pseudomonadota bacterium]